ncbi:protein AMN1 homolog [Mytilus californianus]|uniref:protein AMN1 homolog n=1 Tax=Mytilus californianus TaxID=6549 RepID=UPI002247CC41|nr:protein AMN1 homolog [Mytilus californianus]
MAAFTSRVYGNTTTLLNACVDSVVSHLNVNENGIQDLPPNLKDKCLYLMTKRGFITDSNIKKFLHDKISVLDLSECTISDVGLGHISKCSNLRKIDINSAKESRTEISSEGIKKLLSACPHLQTVYLRRCLNLTDDAIISLSQHCNQLRYLNIGGCRNITDKAMEALGQNSKFLRSINFSKTKVTTEGVVSLVMGNCGKSLKEIHMDGCHELTDEAVEAALQFCPNLSILLFHGCPKITDKSREALEQKSMEGGTPMRQVTWTIY